MPKKIKKTKAKKLTKAEQIAQKPIEEIVKLGGEAGKKQLENYARTLRSGYKRRVGAFKRQGLISYAQISVEATMPKVQVPLKKMTRNQLILEIARYQKFFNDETSSVAGINRINRQQDIRIFGADNRGRPIKTMTQDERLKFWQIYEEYNNQQPGANSRYGSESIQQVIADALFSQQDYLADNLVDILNKVEASLAEKQLEENLRRLPNVYSGRGPLKS